MPSQKASKIFGLLIFLLISNLSLIMGLGKGTHQFSKLLFPLRYWLQVKKNDYQTFLNRLSTPPPASIPVTITPTNNPINKTTVTPQKNYTNPKSNTYYYTYPTKKIYQYPSPRPLPTYDNTWYNQQVQKSQQDYQNRVNQMNQDYQNSVNQMNQNYQNSVQKTQQDTEAWKKAHGF